MTSSTIISVDKQVLGFCLDVDFFAKVKNKIDRDMFDRELKDIFDTIVYSHTKYAKTLTKSELAGVFNDRNPAMPDSARNRVQEVISELEDTVSGNDELHLDLVNNLWLRDRARQIGEKALEIFTGENEEFGELRVAEVFKSSHQLPMADLITDLIDTAMEFGGEAPQADDITLVLVRRLPE